MLESYNTYTRARTHTHSQRIVLRHHARDNLHTTKRGCQFKDRGLTFTYRHTTYIRLTVFSFLLLFSTITNAQRSNKGRHFVFFFFSFISLSFFFFFLSPFLGLPVSPKPKFYTGGFRLHFLRRCCRYTCSSDGGKEPEGGDF